MFNEGVDVPDIDTILMLRPTESRIVWLQQFGRGLRRAEGKDRVTVIDYIGNHRSFLVKPQALLALPEGDAQIKLALDRLEAGELELPPGCEVTYALEAMGILRQLLRTSGAEQLQLWYEDFRMRNSRRPTASEAAHAGYTPRTARGSHGSWLGFVRAMGDLSDLEQLVLDTPPLRRFLAALEKTPMTKSYKMLVLLSLLHADEVPGSLALDRLAEEVVRLASRSAALRQDLDVNLDDQGAVQRLLVDNPIRAWTGGWGAEDVFFTYEDGEFRTKFHVPAGLRDAFVELVRELAEWRLADYLLRPGARYLGPGSFICKISHANRRPMLFLPDRDPQVPEGWTRIVAEGVEYEANFVKVALNVVRRPGSTQNVLPEILRGWFGEAAGLPGTNHQVLFERAEELWEMRPLTVDEDAPDWQSEQTDRRS